MSSYIHALLRHSALVGLLCLLLIFGGFWAWKAIPIDAFPDVTNIQVMILSKAPGLSSMDIEQQVTFPIEQKMAGMKGVVQVRSVSKPGLSQISVIFDDSTDAFFARQLVFERLQEAREEIPPGIEPELAPLSTGLGEVFQYSIESDSLGPAELRTLQDWVLAPQLRTIQGISEVNSFGGFLKQYQVLVDPDRLQKFGLALDQVTSAIERNNVNAGGKFLVMGWEQAYIRAVGLLRSPEDIGNIVLRASGGVPVLVKDVADVVIGHDIRQGAVTRDGKGEAVVGIAIMLRGANSKTVVDEINHRLPEIRASLPKEARLNVFYDRTDLISACIKTVIDALNEGGLCVIIVLFFFLAEISTGLLVVASLPLTFLLCFIIMHYLGIPSNLMSLGGLAFSVGMVCDPAVVVIDNIRRHFGLMASGGGKTDETICRAIAEVARPTLFSMIIMTLVIVPVFALEGLEAKMFNPFALALLIALVASIVITFLFMPSMARYFLPQGEEKEFRLSRGLRSLYRVALDLSLRLPVLPVLAAIALIATTVWIAPTIGVDFMPTLKEGAIAINVVRLPNASLEGAVQVSTEIEKRLMLIPEVKTVVSKSGRAEISEDPMGPEQTDIIITLKTSKELPGARDQYQLIPVIQQELSQFPGLRLAFSQPISLRVNELISGIKSDVAVKVFGDDLDTLVEYSREVSEVLGTVGGIQDVRATQLSGMDQIDIEIDRSAAARYGLNVSDVQNTIETGVGGTIVSHMIEGQRRFSIAVRFQEKYRRDLENLRNLKIPTPSGALIPLSQIGTIAKVEVPIEVARENGRRRMVVEANVRNRDLGSFVGELKAKLKPLQAKLPTGYTIEIGGQFENQERAMNRLSVVVPLALALIFVLLLMALDNARDSLLVLLNLPFAVIGGILALAAWKLTLTVSAAVAFIVLLGIAVQNGVILLTFFRQLLNEGKPLEEAIRTGCSLRFRPLMMTALTTFISHLPMILSTGSGAETQIPLAVVVMGGLFSSTFLTLFVLPVLFRWSERLFGTRVETAHVLSE